METMFVNAEYQGNVLLDKKTLDLCKEYKTIAVYSSIQFIHSLDTVAKQLKDNKIKVITSKPGRASEKSQLLGCDIYYPNLNLKQDPDAFLYIGDGAFHPSALVICQKDRQGYKPVIAYNPISRQNKILTKDNLKKILQKSKAGLVRFLTSDKIGVLISTKKGQEHTNLAEQLKNKYPKKRFYMFLADNINFNELENFNFIQSWVNTACPRIGLEDSSESRVSVVNVNLIL